MQDYRGQGMEKCRYSQVKATILAYTFSCVEVPLNEFSGSFFQVNIQYTELVPEGKAMRGLLQCSLCLDPHSFGPGVGLSDLELLASMPPLLLCITLNGYSCVPF